MLSFALNVKGERVVLGLVVEAGMVSFAVAASVEAVEADVEAVGLVDVIEALCTVFAVD